MNRFGYSFGIEEEFFIVSAADGALIESMPGELLSAARASVPAAVTSELLQSQIEIASPVLHDAAEAYDVLVRCRQQLARVTESMKLDPMAAGTHPSAGWHEQLITRRQRYDQLASDFRIVSERNLVCGLHVHVAVPPGVDRVDVMNRAMPWLPLFLALSTSSPFWNGRITGLLSYRQALYDEWPRSGIPDFFDNEPDYDAFVERMREAGAIEDASHLWWTIRPAARHPTLELRIADACTLVEDSIAIASLFRCLVAALVERPDLGRRRGTHTRRIVDENRWRAKRDGTRARFIDEWRRTTVPVTTVLDDLLALTAEHVDRHACGASLAPLRRVAEDGTSAHMQLRLYNDARAAGAHPAEAMRGVLRWLVEATMGRNR